jgi:outer membrane receptor for ferrienterochelin and colicins
MCRAAWPVKTRYGGRRIAIALVTRPTAFVTDAFLVRVLAAFSVALCLHIPAASAQTGGGLAGKLSATGGEPVGGATVEIVELGTADITDSDGGFRFGVVPPGTYTVIFRVGDHSVTLRGVVINSGEQTTLDREVDWDLSFAEKVVVSGVSRRHERIVEAPASVTRVAGADLVREATHGQVPRALAVAPGVELTQAGANDFNINARGFNTLFNRRILTLVDGRDPSIPGLLGAQEWGAAFAPLDDVESIELVRGPGAALYGAGAFNGVLLITTKAPRDSLGTRARVTFGELGTQRYEGRHAGAAGSGWYFKILGGFHRSGDYTEPRVTAVEYAPGALPLEAVAPPLDTYRAAYGLVRFDKYLANSRAVTLETGLGVFEGTTNPSDLGRVQQTDVTRPWLRVNVNAPRWNVLASTSWRSAPNQVVLSSGTAIYLDSHHSSLEAQGNTVVAAGRGRLVGGLFVGTEFADSRNPEGEHTIYSQTRRETRTGAFGQLDFDVTPALKAVGSLRWDRSTLHDPRWSPRLAVVYTVQPGHTVRLTYNHAFKSPTLSERFVYVPVAPPVNLSPIEAALTPAAGGVSLGFSNIPLLGVGNADLVVETITGFEIGYNAIVGSRTFMTSSYYRNTLSDFTTSLLPQVGTTFGRLNPRFGPYQPPSQLSAVSAAAVVSVLQTAVPELWPIMSNDVDGSPVFVAISNRNYGRVETQGIELGLHHVIAPGWMVNASYNHFDFNVKEDAPESPLVANAPGHQLGVSLMYSAGGLDGAVRYRWVDDFDWATGIFSGRVESYGLIDVSISRQLASRWSVGLDIANALDNSHYEVFGGDLLQRRALISVTYSR